MRMSLPSPLPLKSNPLEKWDLSKISYKTLPEHLKINEEVAKAFCKFSFVTIHYLPEVLKKNKTFLSDLFLIDPWFFMFIDPELKKDCEFVISVMEKTKGMAYFLCHEPAASSPQVRIAARGSGLVLHG
jgi:hypothetical protein